MNELIGLTESGSDEIKTLSKNCTQIIRNMFQGVIFKCPNRVAYAP